jgi:hypothetical protein
VTLQGPGAKKGSWLLSINYFRIRGLDRRKQNGGRAEKDSPYILYLRLISNRQLHQKFVTLRAYRISAVTCWLLRVKNWVPSVGSQSAPERNGNEQVFLRERYLSLPFPFRQCIMPIYHKVPCPNIN